MRGQRERRKKHRNGKRLQRRGALIAVMIAWKTLDRVSSWTRFSVTLPFKPFSLRAEAELQISFKPPSPRQTARLMPISKHALIMEYLIILTREHSVHLELL